MKELIAIRPGRRSLRKVLGHLVHGHPRFSRPYLVKFALRIVWIRFKVDAFLLVYALLDPLLGKDDKA